MCDRVKTKNEGSRAAKTGGYWMRWMVATITAVEYLCGVGLRPRMKGVDLESLRMEAIE